jgi:hypothetical protein
VAAVTRAVEGVAFDREFVLLRGLIEIAQRCMQRTFITDEKGTAIKVRGAGRRDGASGRVQGEGGDARLRACSARSLGCSSSGDLVKIKGFRATIATWDQLSD